MPTPWVLVPISSSDRSIAGRELLNPEFKGKAAILDIPSIGIIDAAMVIEAAGAYKYPDEGNMTKPEIDLATNALQFPRCGQRGDHAWDNPLYHRRFNPTMRRLPAPWRSAVPPCTGPSGASWKAIWSGR
jgi:hypothetical protein